MDKKAFLAVGLSLAIWVGWQKFYLEPIQQQQALHQKQVQEAQALVAKEAAAKAQPAAGSSVTTPSVGKVADAKKANLVTVQNVSLENEGSNVSLSNEPAALSHWELKTFSRTLEKKEDKITMEEATGFGQQLRIRYSDATMGAIADQTWQSLEKSGPRTVTSKLSTPDLEAKRIVTLDETGYGGRIEYAFRFLREPPKFIFLDVYGSPKRASDKEGSIFGQAPDKVHVTFRDPKGRHSHIGASIAEPLESGAGVRWLGLDTRYFVLALVPDPVSDSLGAQVSRDELGAPAVRGSLVFPTDGKRELNFATKLYFGPKNMEALTKVDPVLSDAIDYGWTSAIAIPLLQGLKWLFRYLQNYGLAIIALTFLIKMALFPLMYKSMKSMSKMSTLQPQLNALREKYKDDKEKLNVEMMNFMKANGYNPVGGCLPILLQMPIFFALYRVLFNSMELYQAPFYGWIHDLSSPDPFFVTPILLTGLMYLQQRLSPNATMDPAQQKMMQIMPVMFGAFMLMLPSGLTIYMVVNSVVSIAQQWFLNKRLGIRPGANSNVVAAKA